MRIQDAVNGQVEVPRSRNDPCPCGSGKRFKHCHGQPESASGALTQPEVAGTEAARRLASQGLEAQQRGDDASAEKFYRKSLAIQPDDPDVLHMLGVVRMQQFAPEEALQLIEHAARMTDWKVPAIGHNFGWALSILFSAREPDNLARRALAVAREREERIRRPEAAAPRVAVVALCQTHDEALRVVRQLQSQSLAPASVVILLAPEAARKLLLSSESPMANFLPEIIESALPHSIASIAKVLSRLDTDYVQLIDSIGELLPDRLQRMSSELLQSGALWGFSRVYIRTGAGEKLSEPLTHRVDGLNGLFRTSHRTRLGDVMLERAGLPISLSNLIFDRRFLAQVLTDPLVVSPSLTAVMLAALWASEPLFVDDETIALDVTALGHLSDELNSQAGNEVFDAFVQRVIDDADAPNVLAPQRSLDGPDILKRSLRAGLGARLSGATLRRLATLASAESVSASLDGSGIEFIGFARAESGLGENLRALVRAAATADLPVSVSDVNIDSGIRNADRSMDRYMDGPKYRTRVVCVNPDLLGEAFHHDGFGRYRDAYRIGFWFWELERIPRMWANQARLVDEIWVATDFVADAVRRDVLDRPVTKICTPVKVPVVDREYSRVEFGLRADCCLFMFSFAYGSFATRKNPEAVIRAFRIAFPKGTEQAQLVIKSSQSELFLHARDRLSALAAGDPRIVFVNRYLSRRELIGLQSTIDCYVSLHRSEGLGLGLAECMAQGKPAIATAYSGNLEFMKPENSLLVDYRLIPVRDGEYPDFIDQVWADASVEHAAVHMRSVFDDRACAAEIGRAGATYIAQRFNDQAIGADILKRFREINGLHNT